MFVSSRRPLLPALRVQGRIIRALIIREVLQRYGQENLGFFWVIGEPMFLSFGVMVMWSVSRATEAGSIGVAAFALTGYSHIQLWRQCVSSAMKAIEYSSWLSYHPNVQPLDILIAKSLMSAVGILGSFMLGYLMLYLAGLAGPMRDPLLVIGAWGLDILFCFSFSVVIAALSELSDLVERLLHPIMYLTIPLTGTFTLTAWLPSGFRSVLVWSPLVSTCEMLRAGVFPESVRTYWYPSYVVIWSLALLAVGLPLLAHARRSVEVH